ncbi:hypothetical protein [Campylobacter troglodytis]|nr:hypothetical protein [Campylobacter troglodytis]
MHKNIFMLFLNCEFYIYASATQTRTDEINDFKKGHSKEIKQCF